MKKRQANLPLDESSHLLEIYDFIGQATQGGVLSMIKKVGHSRLSKAILQHMKKLPKKRPSKRDIQLICAELDSQPGGIFRLSDEAANWLCAKKNASIAWEVFKEALKSYDEVNPSNAEGFDEELKEFYIAHSDVLSGLYQKINEETALAHPHAFASVLNEDLTLTRNR